VLVVVRGLGDKDIEVVRPALDRIAGIDLAVDDRCGVLDDVVDVEIFAWKSPTIDCVESTSRCSAGPKPPTACAVSSSSEAILALGSADKPRLAASSAGPISLGTVPLVMVCPGERNFPGLPVDTRSKYCSPIADTECTLADASTGIL
jgi:hypothetical protein